MERSDYLQRGRLALFLITCLSSLPAAAQSPYGSSEDFIRFAEKLREKALLSVEPTVMIVTGRSASPGDGFGYGWKQHIITTLFWIGEDASSRNPVPNHSSSWVHDWEADYGGFDDPDPNHRRNFIPIAFTPRLNPFYCALPYNDVTRGVTKAEARLIVPWFSRAFVREGVSVCQNHWVAIHSPQSGRTCYAQWSDCGPFRTDHWQYVFGNDRPKPNLNGGAGLDISPAVQEYLGSSAVDVTDWKFIDASEVPPGPWRQLGENNTFVLEQRASQRHMADAGADVSTGGDPAGSSRHVR